MNSQTPRNPGAWNPDSVRFAPRAAPTGRVHDAREATDEPLLDRRRLRHLAGVFAVEPELVTACLQGIEQESSRAARQVLAAARLAVRRHPDYADLHFHAARAAVAAGEMTVAANLLERSLRIHPHYKDALILAARVALTRQRTAEAQTYLQTALAQGADYPDVHMLLGAVWRDAGDWPRARQAYQRALQLNSSLATARSALESLPSPANGGANHELPA